MLSGNLNCFGEGKDIVSGSLDAYLTVFDSNSGSMDIAIPSPKLDTSGFVFTFIHGPTLISGSIGIFEYGHQLLSGAMPTVMVFPSFLLQSMGCWLRGEEAASGLANFTIEDLLRTDDHDPQIIGKLHYTPLIGPVYIKVWDITDGINAVVPIANSGCYPIGSTGRWGWSTSNLPVWSVQHPLYYYKMYTPTNETFEGEFFMNKPFNRTHYPEKNEPTIGKFF